MVKERAEWERYRECLVNQVKDYEKAKAAFVEEKAKFESDRKSEEWGREGLWGKLRAAEELLAKEKAEWKKICEKDNQRMYAARTKITEFEGKVAELTGKVEDAQATKENAEVELAEVKAQLSGKEKDLKTKDVEIAELKRRLREQVDKSESLEIDLEAEKGKAASAEETDKRPRRRAMANSILNAGELDGVVAALIDASRAVGHRGGFLECAQHVEEVFGQEFDTSHCSVTNEADAELAHAENAYDHLSLPVMDLVAKALEHDDWCQRLKTILDPPETVELSDEEEPAGNDGDGDGGKHDDDGDDDEHDDDDDGDGHE
ncbi:putative uncharacterized protein MYH16 [Helianthus annuus]|uniref:putative uncharacterized protein MYH16 n=1 Tax=Helianthus annuus TaxID=4232 RepID=UPI000B8F0BCD|nr:putative uncharacterized protein MYH16 [Helianthus annuus]